MVTDTTGNWTVRGMTFVLWAAAAASAAYWGLKLGAGGAGGTPVAPPARAALQADPVAVARLLGRAPGAPAAEGPAPVAAGSRLQLLGVVADGARQGAALIAVDGRPAKPFRVGASVDDGLVLQAVRGRQALLGASAQGQPSLTLELPPPTAPAGGGGGGPVANVSLPPPGPPPAR